jgi:hypothetical protein
MARVPCWCDICEGHLVHPKTRALHGGEQQARVACWCVRCRGHPVSQQTFTEHSHLNAQCTVDERPGRARAKAADTASESDPNESDGSNETGSESNRFR